MCGAVAAAHDVGTGAVNVIEQLGLPVAPWRPRHPGNLGSQPFVDRGPVPDVVPEYVGAVHSWTLPGIEYSFEPGVSKENDRGPTLWPSCTVRPVSLPTSGTQINKLGKRLRDGYPDVSDEDAEMLEQVLICYQAALNETKSRLSTLELEAVTRVKTITTLVEKLRRDRRMQLQVVQDVAGARIIVQERGAQDVVVAAIVREFRDGSKPPVVKDRRSRPNHGYRAVHVIVTAQDLPVEIQVRTRGQDAWAQGIERLGDIWGRGIRYGDGPNDPGALAFPDTGFDITRQKLLDGYIAMSDVIDEVERAQAKILGLAGELDQLPPDDPNRPQLEADIEEHAVAMREATERFQRIVQALIPPTTTPGA